MPDQDRTAVITGASTGIGRAAALRLASDGWHVVVVGRDPERTAEVARACGTEPEVADFSRLDDVRALADRLLARLDRIDVLGANAGGVWPTRTITVDGHETTFQVNHLAPYLLTRLLADRLADSGGRVVVTSSRAHASGRLRLDDLDDTRHRYSATRAYGTSKLANVLFARELPRRLTGIHAASFHPGVVATSFARDGGLWGWLYASPMRNRMRTPERGADSLVWLAQTDRWPGDGTYVVDRAVVTPSRAARDDGLAAGLWDRSAALVGL